MVINIIKDNKSDSKQPVVYDLGTVTTTLQTLLDNSRITITDKQVIILKVTQLDTSVSYYFLPFRDYNGDSLYGYGKEIVVADLIPVGGGSGGGGAVDSVNGQTGVVIIPIPTNTSDLINDGSDGVNPFITAADVTVPNLDEVLEVGNVALDTSIEIRNTSSSVYSTLNYNQINVFSDDKIVRQNQNGFEVNDIISGNVTRNLITGIEHVISGSGQTNVTFETPTGANSIIIPNQSGTIAMLSDIPTIPTAAIDRGTFSGEFALSNAVRGGEYTPLTQTGALTLSAGVNAVNGGIDSVKITANGSAITVPGGWINIGSDSISVVNGAVNRIMVRQYQSEIWYTVKVS